MPYRTWTPRRHEARAQAAAKLNEAVKEVQPAGERCPVKGCTKPSGRATEGLLGRFCKKHGDAYRRHGNPLRPSYTAAETNPWRRAALSWLQANREHDWTKAAVSGIEWRYRYAGRGVAAQNVRGLKPADKANAVWARLRAAEVDPLFVVAAIIGVNMCFERDAQKPSGGWGTEYRRVQVGKVLNRMAGGTVKRWPRDPVLIDDGVPRMAVPPPEELKAFPSSSGRVLRKLGFHAERACELLLAYEFETIIAYADTVPVTKASLKTPWPDGRRAKPKPRIPPEAKPTGPFAFAADVKKRKRQQREKEKKAAALASIVTPEQDAARQPTVKVLKGGRWVDAKDGA